METGAGGKESEGGRHDNLDVHGDLIAFDSLNETPVSSSAVMPCGLKNFEHAISFP